METNNKIRLYDSVHNFVHIIENHRSKYSIIKKISIYLYNVFFAIFYPKHIVNEFEVLLTANEILFEEYLKNQSYDNENKSQS